MHTAAQDCFSIEFCSWRSIFNKNIFIRSPAPCKRYERIQLFQDLREITCDTLSTLHIKYLNYTNTVIPSLLFNMSPAMGLPKSWLPSLKPRKHTRTGGNTCCIYLQPIHQTSYSGLYYTHMLTLNTHCRLCKSDTLNSAQ